ncbi:MAG: radical SAM protein [candidate division WOR-3 bacterium]
MNSIVYGPVQSRRLGRSLGINIIPAKTCTLDCVYCQCGRTTCKTLARRSFYPPELIVERVRQALKGQRVDCLTFSGEGEPTLNRDIGRLIRRLKREFRIPVVVITNSTLLTRPQVRQDLLAADIVVPSLDAVDQRTFMKVNRGHPRLKIERIIAGLKRFRRKYKGRFWLEIMLVKGVNDAVEHVVRLRQVAWELRPDKVHLNTVVRPPAEPFALPMDEEDMQNIRLLFGGDAEICGVPAGRIRAGRGRAAVRDVAERVLASLAGRPSTIEDLAVGLNLPRTLVANTLRWLVRSGRCRETRFGHRRYFTHCR